MRISTDMLYRQGVTAMLDQQSLLAKVQQQLATGRRHASAADDPAAVSEALSLDQRLAELARYQENVGTARHRLTLEESTLGRVTATLQRVRELAIQANSGALTDANREQIAAELRERRDELVALANQDDGAGNFLFTGGNSTVAPFAFGPGGTSYSGDQGRRLIGIGADRAVADGDPGSEVFLRIRMDDGSTQDVFTTVQQLIDGVTGSATPADRSAAVAVSLDQIDRSLGHVSDVRASVGARLNALTDAESTHDALEVQLRETLSGLRDVDYAETVSRMQQLLASLQAAQQSFLKVQGLSLFDYLR